MSKPASSFRFPMSGTELLPGAIYIPVHIIVLDFLIPYAMRAIAPGAASGWSTVVYYSVSFLFILIVMHSFLFRSLRDLPECRINTMTGVVLGFFAYYLMRWLLSIVFWLTGSCAFPSAAAILSKVPLNPGVMLIVSVLLAPVVEEVLFRSVVFGVLRRKSRILAYSVSFLVFAFYCLWKNVFTGFSLQLLFDFIFCLPASLALCLCYEKSGTIWGSIILHILINIVSISISVG